MGVKFPEYKSFDLSGINKEFVEKWSNEQTFKQSLELRKAGKPFIFYEGPPSANGMPGIHHVISRTLKDIFCRYKTLKGFFVDRKAGWDTHGLPVELGVEKLLGITKEDIGTKISVKEYNDTCKREVMKYTREWEDLTVKMGYWVDMEKPYITYDNRYIETLWYLLKQFHTKGLLYKGYTIQPYSPAAGTGLSSHELNQPGCYRDIKDTTCVAQFKVLRNTRSEFLFKNIDTNLFFLAWTTTPWTLPSNTALAVGASIKYVKIKTINPYTGIPITVVLAKELMGTYFDNNNRELLFENYNLGDKNLPFIVLDEYSGTQIKGIQYEQLINWVNPIGKAFEVLIGDFVTTADGTGIVHIAPTFGADDYKVAKLNDVAALLVTDKNGNQAPLVDKKGRFFPIDELNSNFVEKQVNLQTYSFFAGKFVKNEYDNSLGTADPTMDVEISVLLKKDNKAFRIEKYIHSYPHCWRTDKPVLYYPMDSWFIRTTALKDQLIGLNETINWKPESTGSGRFGKWLENLVDWNLSRSRFWGTPLPIWVSEDKLEEKCIGSVADLKTEIDKSVAAGYMSENPLKNYQPLNVSAANYDHFDLHRPFVDEIILVAADGKKMFRETDLIDVWFDSGAMPYAQVHYPFATNNTELTTVFPADFIAEGVDQTRGWFFTLHAISSMLFNSVAFKNIISNGLVLDKSGNKMSKRLGNAIDPFEAIEKYGSDPLRWYMITNAQPWDNLKFDMEGVEEVRRKFFGTLYNTYSFFALYANVDNFNPTTPQLPINDRPEIDRWIISLLNTLILEVGQHYDQYEPNKAGRAIQDFVSENLSNWYVRLNRKRFWGGEFDNDKLSAYQTLYHCLKTVSVLTSPIAPFFADKLFCDLNATVTEKIPISVHLSDFPVYDPSLIDTELEERMDNAQKISSLILGLRRKVNIKVRQPLSKIMIPVMDEKFEQQIEKVAGLILSEINVKNIEYLKDTSGILVKKIKPNFKTIGPKYGKLMKVIAAELANFTQLDIAQLETNNRHTLTLNGEEIILDLEDVEIISEDIPGWLVANEGRIIVALDITITPELRNEGIAREFINRIQNIRKDSGFSVTDKIRIRIQRHSELTNAVENFGNFIGTQTLAESVELVDKLSPEKATEVVLDDEIKTLLSIEKI